jgi:heptosyltransferase-2
MAANARQGLTTVPALLWLTAYRATRFLGDRFFQSLGLRDPEQEVDLQHAKRVLVVRPDEIGDVVMTSPFLRELRRNLPDAWITLVVKPGVYNLVELCPYVTQIITYNWETTGRFWKLRSRLRALALARSGLSNQHFDLALLPRWDTDYYHAGLLAYLSGARCRVTYSERVSGEKSRRNKGMDHFFTRLLYDNQPRHEVERALDMIRALGGTVHDEQLEIWLGPDDENTASQILKSHNIAEDQLLVTIAPGKLDPNRRWPVSNFAAVAKWMKNEFGAAIIVVGGEEDRHLGQELEVKVGDVINAVGRTTLRQTAALIKRCRLFVGNDSGPKHIATAAGVQVIEINAHPRTGSPLHLHAPSRFGPWGPSHQVIQPEQALFPCSDYCSSESAHCILGVAVETVKRVIEIQLIKDRRASRFPEV